MKIHKLIRRWYRKPLAIAELHAQVTNLQARLADQQGWIDYFLRQNDEFSKRIERLEKLNTPEQGLGAK